MRTASEVLDVIDDFLSDPTILDSQRKHLWDTLAALRGPDQDPTQELKSRYTVPVRQVALPKTAQAVNEFKVRVPALFRSHSTLEGPEAVARELDYEEDEDHYRSHIHYAAQALEAMGRLS